jgi:hypothetical protein
MGNQLVWSMMAALENRRSSIIEFVLSMDERSCLAYINYKCLDHLSFFLCIQEPFIHQRFVTEECCTLSSNVNIFLC